MTERTWRDLTWREWVIPPPDGTIPFHPLWDTLRTILCAVLLLALVVDLYRNMGWEAVLLIVVIVGGMAS